MSWKSECRMIYFFGEKHQVCSCRCEIISIREFSLIINLVKGTMGPLSLQTLHSFMTPITGAWGLHVCHPLWASCHPPQNVHSAGINVVILLTQFFSCMKKNILTHQKYFFKFGNLNYVNFDTAASRDFFSFFFFLIQG